MSVLFYNISQVLGIAILHSLWQGLLVWFLLRMVFTGAPQLSSVKKYNMAAVAMLGIAVWFMVTLFREAGNFNWQLTAQAPLKNFTPPPGFVNHVSPFTAPADRYYYVIESYLPYISVLYIAGLVLNLSRLSYCQVKLYRIKKALLPAGDLQWLADEFGQRLGIRRYVQVNFSALVDVPCMIGYLKPIILLPISLATNLSVAETEAILLHELAHIKRNDYLVNLLQQVVNSLLFFNPFAQMISRLISAERENCCDDLVVQTTNSPLVYARALLKLEESRQSNLQLALAAATKKNYLLTRIERIMKTKQKIGNMRHLVLAMILLFGSLSSIAWLNPEIKNGKVTVKAVKPAELLHDIFTTDTARKKPAKAKAPKAKLSAKQKEKLKAEQDWDNNDGDFNFNYHFNDKELEKMSAEIEKQSQVLNKYYKSADFKKLNEQLEKQSKDIEAYYNSDAMKALMRNQEKVSADFEKKFGNNNTMEKTGKQMGELGDKIGKYYDSKEFKDLNARLRNKYGIKDNTYYSDNDRNDPNYKKYQDELKQNTPAEVKNAQEQIKTLGKQMRNFYQSDEFAAGRDRIKALNDSIRLAFSDPRFKQQTEEMRKLGEKMRLYANSPEMEQAKKKLQEAGARMRAYTNSPEFKKRMAEYRKKMKASNWNYNFNYNNNDDEKAEKPEKAEKQEAPEKPEPAEKPETPAQR